MVALRGHDVPHHGTVRNFDHVQEQETRTDTNWINCTN